MPCATNQSFHKQNQTLARQHGHAGSSAAAEALRSLADLAEQLPAVAVRQCNRLSAEWPEQSLAVDLSIGASAEIQGFEAAAASAATAADRSASDLSPQCRSPDSGSTPEALPGRVGQILPVPVTSLDQLYAQALTVAPLMAEMCGNLAAASGGRLDHPPAASGLASSSAASKCDPIAGVDQDSALGQWIRRRWVKAPERAAEKALLCYGGDVSRLVDICRGRIVLNGSEAVLACADRVLRDTRLRVLGIKDLVSADTDRTAGFRVRIREIWFIN